MKRGVSFGWFYLLLFVLMVGFLLVMVIPEEAWPDNLRERLIEKVPFKDLDVDAPEFILSCPDYNEQDCIKNIANGCYPSYSSRGNDFLTCDFCPKHINCGLVGGEKGCTSNPCNLTCRWVVGEYEGGYTLKGKCVHDNSYAQLVSDLNNNGFTAHFERKNYEKLWENDFYILYKTDIEIIVIDKELKFIYVEKNGDTRALFHNGDENEGYTEYAKEIIRKVMMNER